MSGILLAAATALTLSVLAWVAGRGVTPRASGPLRSECYVWQRAWDGAVKEAVRTVPEAVAGLAPLCAEMAWDAEGRLSVVWPAVEVETLRGTGRRVSAVLRIGPRAPTVAAQAEVCRVAGEVLGKLRHGQVEPVELQVDFDCAEAQLAGYRGWLAALRTAVAPVPVRPTVLPSWLAREEFAALAKECGGYVLQVHATQQPRADALETALCEAADARRWVEQAGRLGVLFRVALPTYTYRVAFAPDGRLRGIEAEGQARAWPAGTIWREFRPDAAQLAALVHAWAQDRPACLVGLIWYRLPVATDTQNWRWPTLSAVMQGRAPRPDLQVEQSRPSREAALDLALVNTGEAEMPWPLLVMARTDGAFEDADAVGGYRAEFAGKSVGFIRPETLAAGRIPPGARFPLGWVRTGSDVQIQMQNP